MCRFGKDYLFLAKIAFFLIFRQRNFTEICTYLLARLESAYSLIWGAQEILGKGGGETLALL